MRVDQWTPSGGYTLEPNALTAATETEVNRLLIAGPGAGKTEMLAQRADFLLRTGRCPYPRRILAISFKTDAAANLRRRVAGRCGPELAARLDSYTFHAFAKKLIDAYRVVLTGTDTLDPDFQVGSTRIVRRQITFDDMVPLGTTILATTAVARNAVRNTYSHVFLDEFQDCTTQQYALLRTAFRPGSAVLTAVGDVKQRIMGWAGALEGIFGSFVAGYDAEPLYLYQNFRSAPRVRRVQNAMVKVMDPGAAVPDGDLLGDDGEVAVDYCATSSDEAQRVVDLVERWIKDEGVPPSEIAVLVRQQASLYAYELMDELRSRGIAFRNEQEVQDAFAEPLGQLIIDFLSVTIHVRQPHAYARLMSVVAPRSDDEEYDHLNAARWRRRIERSRSILRDPDGDGQHLISEVERFLADVGNDRLVALSPSYADRSRFDQLLGSVLQGLATIVELGGGRLEAMTHVNDDGAVRILTIHKAKGLEFHTVVVLGVETQTFWSSNALANRSEFFVAISRAKQRLVLTVTARRREPPGADRWDEVRSPHDEFLSYATGLI
jgi:superfamily I DNA/RNA helicase